MDFKVRGFQASDIEQVIDIYIKEFQDYRSTRLGRGFLRKMFSWFLENPNTVNLVAVDDGHVIGFIVGSAGGYGSAVFIDNWPAILLACLARPGMFFDSDTYCRWRVFLKRFFGSKSESGQKNTGRIGIASFAVESAYKGLGVGSMLLDAFEREVCSKGYKSVSASAKSANVSAVKYYEARGFKVHSSNERSIYLIKALDS